MELEQLERKKESIEEEEENMILFVTKALLFFNH